MPAITFTQLRANLARYLESIESGGEELVVTRPGHDPLVIVPLAKLEGLRETLHLLSSPANAAHLLRSMKELDQGKGRERKLIERRR